MILQESSPGVALKVIDGRATLWCAERSVRSWPVLPIASLSTRRAKALVDDGTLLFLARAAPAALEILREAGRSYATHAGEWFLVEPPDLLVVKPPDREGAVLPASPERPLGKSAVRIARWLLLHPDAQSMMISDLARETGVSEATASRAVGHVAGRGLIDAAPSATDARRRLVDVRDRGALLDAVTEEGPWRRVRRVTWDVGAHTTDEALQLIRTAPMAKGSQYAIGGLAGAAYVDRVVEPAAVTLWLPESDLEVWKDALLAEVARPADGRIVASIAPDPTALDWGTVVDGLRIADLVQLYVDCRHTGERGIDAAETLRQKVLAA